MIQTTSIVMILTIDILATTTLYVHLLSLLRI